MGWFDDVGKGTVDEAAAKLAPLTDDIMTRLRGTIYESLERFDGATIDLTIVDGKVRVTVTLSPVSPPAVKP